MSKWQNRPDLTNPKEGHIPGSLDAQYSERPLDIFAKEQIGIALYKYHKEELKESETKAGAFLQDSQIVFLETPRDDAVDYAQNVAGLYLALALPAGGEDWYTEAQVFPWLTARQPGSNCVLTSIQDERSLPTWSGGVL